MSKGLFLLDGAYNIEEYLPPWHCKYMVGYTVIPRVFSFRLVISEAAVPTQLENASFRTIISGFSTFALFFLYADVR